MYLKIAKKIAKKIKILEYNIIIVGVCVENDEEREKDTYNIVITTTRRSAYIIIIIIII